MLFFFFNDTATTEIYTLSLHDALPIFIAEEDRLRRLQRGAAHHRGTPQALLDRPLGLGELGAVVDALDLRLRGEEDRKSTRLNSSHANISYAVFCLKKKKHKRVITYMH